MSEGDRIKRPRYRLLIFSILLAAISCAAVWASYENVHNRERRQAAGTAKYERFIECISFGQFSAAQCKSQADKTRDDQSIEAYDLKAQQEMTRWAALMLIVTSVGVVYVALTLRHAEEANLAAQDAVANTRDIGEAQARAYLSAIRCDIRFKQSEWRDKTPNIDVILHLNNSGMTPAVNVSLCCESAVSIFQDTEKFAPMGRVISQTFINNVPAGATHILEVICFGVARDWSKVRGLWEKFDDKTPIGNAPVQLFRGMVFYDDVFGNTFRSEFCFWLEEERPKTLPYSREDLPTIQAKVRTFERIRDRVDFIVSPDMSEHERE